MKKFAIFCFPRTGSYRLVDLINQTNSAICYGEVFKKDAIELPENILSELNLNKKDVAKRNKFPINFYNKLVSITPEYSKVGFKIFPNHNGKLYKYLLRQEDVANIFLARNPVQSFILLKVAQSSGIWVKKTDSNIQDEMINIDFEELFDHIIHQYSAFMRFKSITEFKQKDVLYIDYNRSLVKEGVADLYNYLGIEQEVTMDTEHKKIIEKDYSTFVSNWSEVSSYLKTKGLDENISFFEFNKIFFNAPSE